MKVMQKISLVSDVIDRNDIVALVAWLLSKPTPRLTKGELTLKLEEEWAAMVGMDYSVYVNSGSSAILLLLAAHKELLWGDLRIVCPAVSWVTDVSSPLLLDYHVTLCDCNMDDLSCDLNQLEDIFKKEQPDIFLSVAPLGLIPDIEAIRELCYKHMVVFIEDNCESMGSKIGDKMLGCFGEASVFSMYYGHHLSTIEGGFVNTSNKGLYEVLVSMRSHGWARDWPKDVREREKEYWGIDDFTDMYTFYYSGLNLRATDLQAFIGLRMLKKLEEFSSTRNENFHYYNLHLKGNGLNISERDNEFISNFAYPFVHPERDKIVKDLIANNVEVRPLIAGNMGLQPFWIKKHGEISLPNADIIHKQGFYLPNHQDLKAEEMDRIIEIVNKYV